MPDFPAFPPAPPSFGMLPRNVQMRLQLGRMMFHPHRPPTYEVNSEVIEDTWLVLKIAQVYPTRRRKSKPHGLRLLGQA